MPNITKSLLFIIAVFAINQYSSQLPTATTGTSEGRRIRICGKSELAATLNTLCSNLNIKNSNLSSERMNNLYPLLDKQCCVRNKCGELFMSFFCPYLRGDDEESPTEEPGPPSIDTPVKAMLINTNYEFKWTGIKSLWPWS